MPASLFNGLATSRRFAMDWVSSIDLPKNVKALLVPTSPRKSRRRRKPKKKLK